MHWDVHELEPGNFFITHTDGRIEIVRYWAIEDGIYQVSDVAGYTEVEHEFERRFSDLVESRCKSDVCLGALLTGGIDSPSIVERLTASYLALTSSLCFADN